MVSRPDSLWGPVNIVAELLVAFVTYASLAWAWWRHPTRRYRSILVQYAFMLATINLSWALVVTILVDRGLPDVSVLLSSIGIANLAWMIRRYQLLKDPDPDWSGPLFPILSDLVLAVTPQGTVAEVSPRVAAVLGYPPAELRGRAAADVLSGWPGLPAAIEGLRAPCEPPPGLEGQLGSGRYRLDLTPIYDRFQELTGILFRLEPVTDLAVASSRFSLSPREGDIVLLIREGLSTDEIARTLFISPATVKKHVNNLFRKTGVTSRGKLVRALQEASLVVP